MGVGKSMKTFIAAMNKNMSGYGSQIKNTPMGPFRWNDSIELWENVNNGMKMPNISFQDMFLGFYEGTGQDDGSGESSSGLAPILGYNWGNLSTGLLNLNSSLENVMNQGYYSSNSGATSSVSGANTVTFGSTIFIQGAVQYLVPSGITFSQIASRRTISGGGGTTFLNLLTGFTVNSGDQVEVRIIIGKTGWTDGNSGSISINNITNGITLYQIPFVVTSQGIEPPGGVGEE
jgi:hypothetical protein